MGECDFGNRRRLLLRISVVVRLPHIQGIIKANKAKKTVVRREYTKADVKELCAHSKRENTSR
jgi:hypothetical protein